MAARPGKRTRSGRSGSALASIRRTLSLGDVELALTKVQAYELDQLVEMMGAETLVKIAVVEALDRSLEAQRRQGSR